MSLASLERTALANDDLRARSTAREDAGERGTDAPLRIVHVLRAPLGGLFRHVLDLTREQVARGHAVGVITDSTTGGEGADKVLGELEPSLQLGLLRLPMRRAPHPSDLRAILQVRRRLGALRPDVIHGHGSKGGFYARMTGFLPGLGRAVRAYTPHGGSFNQKPGSFQHRLYMMTERALAWRTEVLLFESAFIASRFDAFVGPTSNLRRVIPNGIAPAEFEPVQPRADAAEFLYVGELRAAKGIDTLLSALVETNRRTGSKPRLILVGSGPDVEALRQKADVLGLAGQVSFPGPMPARVAFPMGRILVVPSRAESLPYIVLEAAGAHLPLVSTNVGGIPEIFGPYADRLIPSDDVDILASAMIAAWQAPAAQRQADARSLAAYVRQRFSFENMAVSVIDGYHEALVKKRSTKSAPATLR